MRERKMNMCCFPFFFLCRMFVPLISLSPYYSILLSPFFFFFCCHCFLIIFTFSLFCLTLHPPLLPSLMIRSGYQSFSDSLHVYFHSHLSPFILLLHLIRHFLYSIFTSMFAVNTCLSRLAKMNHYTH